jgi:osmotically-inducible protein OsmY
MQLFRDVKRDIEDELRSNAETAIKRELPYSWEMINISVESGMVTLKGEVEWQYQRERVEEAVQTLRCVTSVVSLIGMRPRVGAVEIESKVREALRQVAKIESNRSSVKTTGGEAILGDAVRSWAGRGL